MLNFNNVILHHPTTGEWSVRAFLGSCSRAEYQGLDFSTMAEIRDLCSAYKCHYVCKDFPSLDEAMGFALGLSEANDYMSFGLYFVPNTECDPGMWLTDSERCRWVERIYCPEWALGLLIGATSSEEFIDYYGEDEGPRLYSQYCEWEEAYKRALNMESEQWLNFEIADAYAERPSTSFEPFPIFGEPDDCIAVDVYLLNN